MSPINLQAGNIDDGQARIDWIQAKQCDDILPYIRFIKDHPYDSRIDEAEMIVSHKKEYMLADMKNNPMSYSRELMFHLVDSGVFSKKELVDESRVLTSEAFERIVRYPYLCKEQKSLLVDNSENPLPIAGNADVFFWGICGSGVNTIRSALFSVASISNLRYNIHGNLGGGVFALDMANYIKENRLPPIIDRDYLTVVDTIINDKKNIEHPISFIVSSGEKFQEMAAFDHGFDFSDLGSGLGKILNNDNKKIIFFIIDPTFEKKITLNCKTQLCIDQSDCLNCITTLLLHRPNFMNKVVAMNIIVSKCDLLTNGFDSCVISSMLAEKGYSAFLQDVTHLCERFKLNSVIGNKPSIIPFSLGKFMPGDTYCFDPSCALKLTEFLTEVTPTKKIGLLNRLFN